MITDARFAAWLGDSGAQRVTLFEVVVKVAGVDTTRYLSTKAYNTSASTPYQAVVAGGLKVTESIFMDSTASLSAGDIEIHNADGARDAWLEDIWVNQPVNAFVGDVRWDRTDFRQVFSGVIVDIGCKSRDRLNLRLVNKLEPQWELVRVVVMRDEGVRPANFKAPAPADDNSYIGRCRFVRADGGQYWRQPTSSFDRMLVTRQHRCGRRCLIHTWSTG